MAKAGVEAFLLQAISGRVGDVVVRQTSRGPVVSRLPKRSRKKPTAAQREAKDKFAAAVRYAKEAASLPEYQDAAKRTGRTAMNIATAAFYRAPEIRNLDCRSYRGRVGDEVHVIVLDDVKVVEVALEIVAEDGELVERAVMAPQGRKMFLCDFRATVACRADRVTITVTARNLPGNTATKATEHEISAEHTRRSSACTAASSKVRAGSWVQPARTKGPLGAGQPQRRVRPSGGRPGARRKPS